MGCHFIECYEDEREVLGKIAELKKRGFSEADMYVVARSNEQLPWIRTRTDVEYHTVEGTDKRRLRKFLFGWPLSFYPADMAIAAETKKSVFFYQQLLEGRLLLFCRLQKNAAPGDWPFSSNQKERKERPAPSPVQQRRQSDAEDRIFIDSKHYETFQPTLVESLQNRPDKKMK